jgi:hypothetical protein
MTLEENAISPKKILFTVLKSEFRRLACAYRHLLVKNEFVY